MAHGRYGRWFAEIPCHVSEHQPRNLRDAESVETCLHTSLHPIPASLKEPSGLLSQLKTWESWTGVKITHGIYRWKPEMDLDGIIWWDDVIIQATFRCHGELYLLSSLELHLQILQIRSNKLEMLQWDVDVISCCHIDWLVARFATVARNNLF